jgi:hypothetical protein
MHGEWHFPNREPICTRQPWVKSFELSTVLVDDRNLIFGHKLHIGMPYCGKWFWTRQIPTSCLPTLLIFIHIEHICTFFVTFFSSTNDGRNLIFGHKLPNIRFLPSTVTEKNATKNILDGRTDVKQYTPLPLCGAGYNNTNMSYYNLWTYICICTFFVTFF